MFANVARIENDNLIINEFTERNLMNLLKET